MASRPHAPAAAVEFAGSLGPHAPGPSVTGPRTPVHRDCSQVSGSNLPRTSPGEHPSSSLGRAPRSLLDCLRGRAHASSVGHVTRSGQSRHLCFLCGLTQDPVKLPSTDPKPHEDQGSGMFLHSVNSRRPARTRQGSGAPASLRSGRAQPVGEVDVEQSRETDDLTEGGGRAGTHWAGSQSATA